MPCDCFIHQKFLGEALSLSWPVPYIYCLLAPDPYFISCYVMWDLDSLNFFWLADTTLFCQLEVSREKEEEKVGLHQNFPAPQ